MRDLAILDRCARRHAAAIAVTLLLTSAAALPGLCRANGDPASDVLPVQDLFLPYQPKVSRGLERSLERTVRDAAAAGFHLKVAIINAPIELGLATNFYGHPQAYAQFLDREISFNQAPRPLLVVMPAGFGVIPLGDAPALARLRIDRHASSDGLTRAAIHAVVVLARRRGVRIVPRSAASGSSGGSLPAPLVFGLPVALLALVGLVLTRRRSAREHRQDHREPDAQA